MTSWRVVAFCGYGQKDSLCRPSRCPPELAGSPATGGTTLDSPDPSLVPRIGHVRSLVRSSPDGISVDARRLCPWQVRARADVLRGASDYIAH